MANNYADWWNQTVTVYNKYEDPTTRAITWYKTVITGCFWKYVGDKITVGNTTLVTDSTICRIRKNDYFKEKYLWDALSATDKGSYFTLAAGDIIVKGTVSDTIDEYQSGSRSSDLMKKYQKLQGCMQVERVAINVDGNRGNEHYYVKGV